MVCFSLGVQGITSVAEYVEHVQKNCCSILMWADTEKFVYNIHFRIPLFVNAWSRKMLKKYVWLNLQIFTNVMLECFNYIQIQEDVLVYIYIYICFFLSGIHLFCCFHFTNIVNHSLDMFAKLWKVVISFVMSFCPSVWLSVCVEQLGSHWNCEIWYLNVIQKSVEKIPVSLKYDKNDRYFMWGPAYICDNVPLNYS